jgi:spore coat polysaccharide biosynthesis protein SpsF (cytidylyltransferase family)
MAIAVTFQARVPSGRLLHKLLRRLQELKICRGPAWDKKKALER